MSEKLQAAVKDSIAAAQRSGLKSKGDIASYVAQDPSVRLLGFSLGDWMLLLSGCLVSGLLALLI